MALNKLEKRLRQSSARVKAEDFIQVMDFVGNLNTVYRTDTSGAIIASKEFRHGKDYVELVRMIDKETQVTGEPFLRATEEDGKTVYETSLKYINFIKMMPVMLQAVAFFLKHKDDLIALADKMTECHAIHSKVFIAHKSRQENHDVIPYHYRVN